ncbi:hypothetical protein KC960_02825 [Candidatus Saccharibacteria bacterium]|nr:hypothetical protein [Candidatus Saccharibacteria bacterium]
MDVFTDLRSGQNEICKGFPDVAETAVRFGESLAQIAPEWLFEGDTTRVQTFSEVGGLIVRDRLRVDLAQTIFNERNQRDGLSQSRNGVWFYTNFNLQQFQRGVHSTTQQKISEIYFNAFGVVPNISLHLYDFINGVSGYQYPHRDAPSLRGPTISFGSGPGGTRIIDASVSDNIPYSNDGIAIVDNLQQKGLACLLDTNKFDFGVFAGQSLFHHGMRLRTEQGGPRLSLVLNAYLDEPE